MVRCALGLLDLDLDHQAFGRIQKVLDQDQGL